MAASTNHAGGNGGQQTEPKNAARARVDEGDLWIAKKKQESGGKERAAPPAARQRGAGTNGRACTAAAKEGAEGQQIAARLLEKKRRGGEQVHGMRENRGGGPLAGARAASPAA